MLLVHACLQGFIKNGLRFFVSPVILLNYMQTDNIEKKKKDCWDFSLLVEIVNQLAASVNGRRYFWQ